MNIKSKANFQIWVKALRMSQNLIIFFKLPQMSQTTPADVMNLGNRDIEQSARVMQGDESIHSAVSYYLDGQEQKNRRSRASATLRF